MDIEENENENDTESSEPNSINPYFPERISSTEFLNQLNNDDPTDPDYEPSTDPEFQSYQQENDEEFIDSDSESMIRDDEPIVSEDTEEGADPILREQSPPNRQSDVSSSPDTSGYSERPQWSSLKPSRSEIIGCRDWTKTKARNQNNPVKPPPAPTTTNPESIATRKIESEELMVTDSPKAQESIASKTMRDDSPDIHFRLLRSPVEWYLSSGNSDLGCKMNKSAEAGYVKRKSKNPFIVFFLSMYSRRPKKRAADVARQAGRIWCRMSDKQREKYISSVTDGILKSAKPRQPRNEKNVIDKVRQRRG